MKISDLLKYQEQINQIRSQDWLSRVSLELQALEHAVVSGSGDLISHTALCTNISAVTVGVEDSLRRLNYLDSLLQDLLNNIQTQVSALEPQYLARSERLYRDQLRFRDVFAILERVLPMTSDQKILLENRLQRHSGWQDTGLCVRPGAGDIIESMSGMGTLYVFDHAPALTAQAMSRFPEQHRDRFRDYHGVDPTALRQLPADQMRLIFVHNFFNYLSMSYIDQYIAELVCLLRPGGALICTVNNCDHAVNVDMAERNYQCYTPGHLLIKLAQRYGLVLTDQQWFSNGVSWIEFARPGKYRSLKASPISTKIHARPK